MKKRKKYIILDYDGTCDMIKKLLGLLIQSCLLADEVFNKIPPKNFEDIDHIAIREEIYKDIRRVIKFDIFLWKINRQDIITNSYWLFVFRLFLYELVACSKLSDLLTVFSRLKKHLAEYKKIYLEYRIKDIPKVKALITLIENIDDSYKVLIVTHNPFLAEIKKELPIIVSSYKPMLIRALMKKNDIIAIAGNNYMDDIMFQFHCWKLNASYIGNGGILKSICNIFNINNYESIDGLVCELKGDKRL